VRSLRARLLAGTAAATAALFAVSCVMIYVGVRASLLAEFDAALATQARALTALTEWHGSQLRMEADSANLPEFQPGAHAEYFELFDGQGSSRAQSPSLAGVGPGFFPVSGDLPPGAKSIGDKPVVTSVTLPDGRAGRQLVLWFQPGVDADDESPTSARAKAGASLARMMVARDTVKIDDSLSRLRRVLLLVGGVATVAALGLMSLVVRRGLRPLGDLASRINLIGDQDLGDRIALRDTPEELRPVVDRLNEMLGRVEAAVDRERCFSADVAHELRTPLAGLETTLEVCTSRPRAAAEYADVARRCLQTTRATRRMVETLIALSRADARQFKLASRPVQIASLVESCWAEYQDRAAERRLKVDVSVDDLVLQTDPAQLALVLRNLFDNAVTYADEGGNVTLAAVATGEEVLITVSNTGCGLSEVQIGQVFERFWRGDESRSQTGDHCGLGLPLCRKIVELLGGTIVATREHERFSIALTFSAAHQTASPDSAHQSHLVAQ
jgi:two-component system heavy metal sensor histidine kinase CusS